jgi:hypothetical protein
VVVFETVRRRRFGFDPAFRFALFAASIFFVAAFCFAVRRLRDFRFAGGFTMNRVPILSSV